MRQLAKRAGVSNPYLSQIERGLRKPSAEMLAQIAHGLQISVETLLAKAGILDATAHPNAAPSVVAAIRADQGLTDRQKTSMLEIYQSFRGEALPRTSPPLTRPRPNRISRGDPKARRRTPTSHPPTSRRQTSHQQRGKTMSFIIDIRNVSDSAVSQLAERFNGLPRPLLAAIGAGDFTVERLAELRDALAASVSKSAPNTGDVREFAGDLPAKLTDAAGDLVESVQKFAAEAPSKTQELVTELPGKAGELQKSLTSEQMKAALDGYTQLAAAIYGSLADRGDAAWNKVVATAGYDAKAVTTTVKSAAASASGTVKRATAKAAEAADDAADAASKAEHKARAGKASAVHAENAAARKATSADSTAKTARKTTPTTKAATARRSATASKPRTAKPAPKAAGTTSSTKTTPSGSAAE